MGATPRYDHVSFLSDYGTRDEFVGVVKGVIADIAPHVRVIDVTHDIPPFDVRAGSLALARAVSYLPSGVVLAVVDPGVGTTRRAVAVSVGGGRGVLVGPDNGLLSMAVALAGGSDEAVVLTDARWHLEAPGATFAGRDVFAPVAAHLCNGVPLAELGESIATDLLMPGVVPIPRVEGDAAAVEVTWVDRYGNCQLNVGPGDLPGWASPLRIVVTTPAGERVTRSAAIAASFAGIGAGLGLVVDSYGMYALCIDRGSAAEELGLASGDAVTIERGESAGSTGTAPRETRVEMGRRGGGAR